MTELSFDAPDLQLPINDPSPASNGGVDIWRAVSDPLPETRFPDFDPLFGLNVHDGTQHPARGHRILFGPEIAERASPRVLLFLHEMLARVPSDSPRVVLRGLLSGPATFVRKGRTRLPKSVHPASDEIWLELPKFGRAFALDHAVILKRDAGVALATFDDWLIYAVSGLLYRAIKVNHPQLTKSDLPLLRLDATSTLNFAYGYSPSFPGSRTVITNSSYVSGLRIKRRHYATELLGVAGKRLNDAYTKRALAGGGTLTIEVPDAITYLPAIERVLAYRWDVAYETWLTYITPPEKRGEAILAANGRIFRE